MKRFFLCAAMVVAISGLAAAQTDTTVDKTVTGKNGKTATVDKTINGNQVDKTVTGPNGKTATVDKTVNGNQVDKTMTGPNGKTATSDITRGPNGGVVKEQTGPNGGKRTVVRKRRK